MKIIGTKYEGQESSICYLNTDKEVFFALNSDRVSRIKKDNLDIEQLLNYTKKKILLRMTLILLLYHSLIFLVMMQFWECNVQLISG